MLQGKARSIGVTRPMRQQTHASNSKSFLVLFKKRLPLYPLPIRRRNKQNPQARAQTSAPG
jgi:hypothetical protein